MSKQHALIALSLIVISIPLNAQRMIDTFAGGTIRSGVNALDVAIGAAAGMAADKSGNLVFADSATNSIRRVGPSGTIDTIAGTGAAGVAGDGGPATDAQVCPGPLAFDSIGNLYLAGCNRIRKIAVDGTISTVAGAGISGILGQDGPATQAQLNFISGLAFDSAGNLYFAERDLNQVRRLTPAGRIESVAGGGNTGSGFCTACALGDEGPAAAAYIYRPSAIAIDPAGNLYIATGGVPNGSIRRITADGVIHEFAGYKPANVPN